MNRYKRFHRRSSKANWLYCNLYMAIAPIAVYVVFVMSHVR